MAKVRSILVLILIVIAAPGVLSQSYPLDPTDPVIVGALSYIAAHQNADGGFGQLGESDLATTRVAIEAIAAAGGDPLVYEVGGVGPDDFMHSVSEAVFAGELGTNPLAEKVNLLLSLTASGLSPRDFGGRDHVESLMSEQNQSTGVFGAGPSDTAYSILALLASGVAHDNPALQKARDSLEASQLPNGGFEYIAGFGDDSNTLAVIIVALKQMGSCRGCFNAAVDALPSYQNPDTAGFFYQAMWRTDPDVSSTALGIQAIIAGNGHPQESPYIAGDENPVKYILGMQNATTGEFFDPWGSLRPTSLAVPAILGKLGPGVAIVGEVPTLLAGLVILPFLLRKIVGGGRG
jgi:hypothetical protein